MARRVGVSHVTVMRVWHKAGLQPHRLRRYMASPDPDFEAKAKDHSRVVFESTAPCSRVLRRRKDRYSSAGPHATGSALAAGPTRAAECRVRSSRNRFAGCCSGGAYRQGQGPLRRSTYQRRIRGVSGPGRGRPAAPPDTVVLGLGFPTLIPENGIVPMTTARAEGIMISGIIFDAGATTSPALLRVGSGHAQSDNEASDPSGLRMCSSGSAAQRRAARRIVSW